MKKLALLCAFLCLCFLAGCAGEKEAADTGAASAGGVNTMQATVYGFIFEGDERVAYYPIPFHERRLHGITGEYDVGLVEDDTYKITEADLGDFMGVVGETKDARIAGKNVYHYAKMPEKDSICIVDKGEGYYAFYEGSALRIKSEIGESIDDILEEYGLPESLVRLEVLRFNGSHIRDIEKSEKREAIFEILAGKVNIGSEEREQIYAKAEEKTENFGDINLENTRKMVFELENGFTLSIRFEPCLNILQCGNGAYELSDEDCARLQEILG